MSAAEGAGRGAPPAGSTAGAPSFPAGGVTEIRGPAQDVQAQLFGEGDPWRPAAQGFTSAREVAAAAEGARQSMSVHGGAAPGQGGGIVTVDGDGLRSTSEDLGRAAGELGEAAAALVPLTAELELWALTGQALLGDAAALSGALVASVLEHTAGVALTAGRLGRAALRYDVTEHALTGSFTAAALGSPLGGLSASFAREAARTAEDVEVALARADVDSPAALRERVRFSALGVIVRGGGPHGTDAVIRGPGVDDLLDGVLQLPGPGGVPGREDPGAGHAPGGAAASGSSPLTLGQYLRGVVVGRLDGAGRRLARGPGEGDPPATDAELLDSLEPAVAAMMLANPTTAGIYALYRTGRRLSAAERPGPGLTGVLRGLEKERALYPARREVFTGVTPATAAAQHMTPLSGRPLPAGVHHDGAVPTTVAGTAAALKDAKSIVSGTDADGRPVENSTVMVQKATGADGRTAYSVVLTGTEKWTDSAGVHDLKGIGQGMTTVPSAPLSELPQAQRMAVQALRDAGIRPGDTVVLTGHSLGGIDAAGLAANQQFRGLYDVAAVTTFGAPVGDFAIPGETSVMAVEHVDDVVPTLDGVPNPDGAHRSTVQVNTPYAGALEWDGGRTGATAHEMHLYTVGAQGISGSGHPVVLAHEQRLADAVPHGPGTRTESYVYEGWEEHTGLDGVASPRRAADRVR